MTAAAEELDFERAARLRDDISALRRALEKQAVVFGDGTDADVVAFADDELEAAVQVFHVRGGRVRGQRGWVVEKPGEPRRYPSRGSQLVEQFLTQFYGDQAELDGAGRRSRSNPVPRQVLVPCLPANSDELANGCRSCGDRGWSCGCRSVATRRRSPRPCSAMPRMRLQQHKLKRAGDFNARSAALQSIQDALGLASCAAANRVRRHQPCAGHRCGGLAGGVRGRAAAQVRLPALRDQGGRRRRPLR